MNTVLILGANGRIGAAAAQAFEAAGRRGSRCHHRGVRREPAVHRLGHAGAADAAPVAGRAHARAGDFFGAGEGTWIDQAIAKDIAQGRIVLPGDPELPHAWAYLPDLARAFVALAGKPLPHTPLREAVRATLVAMGHGPAARLSLQA